MSKASVIIPTYKRSNTIIDSIESVLNQECNDKIEIIVVDDNGKNDYTIQTENLLNDYIKNEKIVFIKHEENKGAAEARNTGSRYASGKYLFFLDDDDIYLKNKVKHQITFLDDNSEYDGCLSAFIRLDDNGDEIQADTNYPHVGTFKNFVLWGNFFTPMLCIFRESFVRIGGFRNIPRFQDTYFMLHCLKNGMRFAEINEQLYIMHEHRGERITSTDVQGSIASLDMIKAYVTESRNVFSDDEWNMYQKIDNDHRAQVFYVNGNNLNRLKSIIYLERKFNLNYFKTVIKIAIKTILKIKLISKS